MMTGERSVNVGGNMHRVANATGDNAIAGVSPTEVQTHTPSKTISLHRELAAVRRLLLNLEGLDREAFDQIEKASAEATKRKPDRSKLLGLLEQIARAAGAAAGFADHADGLVSHFSRIVTCLGQSWSDWAPRIGL